MHNIHLPVGIILKDSALKKSFQSIQLTDIDEAVIDLRFHVVSPLILTMAGIRFNFNQVTLFDLENVLFNKYFDPRGISITMIVDGEINKDTKYKLTAKFQETATKLRHQKHHINSNDFRVLYKLIKNVRAKYKKTLSITERFLSERTFHIDLIPTAVYQVHLTYNSLLFIRNNTILKAS